MRSRRIGLRLTQPPSSIMTNQCMYTSGVMVSVRPAVESTMGVGLGSADAVVGLADGFYPFLDEATADLTGLLFCNDEVGIRSGQKRAAVALVFSSGGH